MKVSKVVAIVVALHVLVIGGIFVFEGCSRAKTPASQLADNESQPGDKTATPTPAPVTETNLTSAVAPTPAPAPAPLAPAPAPAIPAKAYTVKKGDSLYKIAKAEKITVEQLAKANNLTKASKLQIGQKLEIPAGAPMVAKADKPATTVAPTTSALPATSAPLTLASTTIGSGNSYEVKNGDSLWKIAKDNHTTVAALKQANNLSKDALKVGQKLTIPVKTTATAPATTTTTPAVGTTPAGTTGAAASSTPAVIAPSLAN